MSYEHDHDQGLLLGLSLTSQTLDRKQHHPVLLPPPPAAAAFTAADEPSLALTLSGKINHLHDSEPAGSGSRSASRSGSGSLSLCSRQASPVSSFSTVVKRERGEEADVGGDDHDDDDGNNINSGSRKKLRLTKDQSALLEESFKQHSTLNPKQKQALAHQLNLRPRQVEVWFQNRRARTKLKQTEVDCEFLKKCCETLTEENRRLHRELQELKALKLAQPFYMQLPAATLTMCPSCERIGAGGGGSKAAFGAVASKAHHQLFSSFPNQSTAC